MGLRRCLQITNRKMYEDTDKNDPRYDKVHQIQWFLNAICNRCKAVWNLGRILTIDEMMIFYKRTYFPIRQYMLNKCQKWGLKVWCLACSYSKYVWAFEIYCGKKNIIPKPLLDLNVVHNPTPPPMAHGQGRLAHNVELKMVKGLSNVGHVVIMDNFFSSIGLFKELLKQKIYATGTKQPNCVGLPLDLKNTKSFKNASQGTIYWRMHDSRQISCTM